jgi:hypothetical protein
MLVVELVVKQCNAVPNSWHRHGHLYAFYLLCKESGACVIPTLQVHASAMLLLLAVW